MGSQENEALKAKFFKVYADLPDPERHQVIAVIDGKGWSWNQAHNEISDNTDRGMEILTKMAALGIL